MKFCIQVYGCQMNAYDSQRIRDILTVNQYEETENVDIADIVIFYTCNIREKAVTKLFSDIGRIKNKEHKIIAVGGCVAQAEGKNILAKNKYVKIIFGPQTYHRLLSHINTCLNCSSEKIVDLEFLQTEKFKNLSRNNQPSFSEFITIQEGCDNFCTYCVVPYTRGREYSRPAIEIIQEAKTLIDHGVQEITFIGQNVNSYHGEPAYITIGQSKVPWRLERLLLEIANIPGLKRLRYTTSHPNDFTYDLMKIHEDYKEIIPPFVHIPVQSGNNRILKIMNRGHSAEAYLEKINKFREICPSISFSSDFIVGFPGETMEEFYDTVELARKVQYSLFYAFKYSPRKNTPAYNMKDQIPEKDKEKRLSILLKELCSSQLAFNQKCVGTVQKVLFEKRGKKDKQYVGKSPYLQSVIVESDQNIIGTYQHVNIMDAFQNCLFGIIS